MYTEEVLMAVWKLELKGHETLVCVCACVHVCVHACACVRVRLCMSVWCVDTNTSVFSPNLNIIHRRREGGRGIQDGKT